MNKIFNIVEEKVILTVVKMVRKTLFNTIAIGVRTTTMVETGRAQLRIWQRQLGIYSQ